MLFRSICNLVIEENKTRGENEKKLYLMYDQIYWTLTFGDTVHYNPVTLNPAMKEFTIFIDGISKAFAATGVRVGWAMGPAELIVKMRSINSHVGAWAPMAEQKAVANYLVKTEAIDNRPRRRAWRGVEPTYQIQRTRLFVPPRRHRPAKGRS